jgi:hypothetical protein
MIRTLFFKKKSNEEVSERDVKTATEVKDTMKRSLLAPKPSPTIEEPYKERSKYLIGSLSHVVSHATINYHPLPDFPIVPPDASVRAPKPTVTIIYHLTSSIGILSFLVLPSSHIVRGDK